MQEPDIRLVGRLIVLRDWREEDISVYVGWQSPEHHWHELDGPYYPKSTPDDLPAIEARLRERLSQGT